MDDTTIFVSQIRPHSNIPPLMSDDILVNIAPSLKVRECKQQSSLANSIHNTALVRPPAGQGFQRLFVRPSKTHPSKKNASLTEPVSTKQHTLAL